MKLTIFTLVFILSNTCFSSNYIDSLKKVIFSIKNDTVKINTYIEWDLLIYEKNPKLDKQITLKIIEISKLNLKKKNLTISEKLFFRKKLAWAYNSFGIFHENDGNYLLSLDFHFKSLSIKEKIRDKKGIAASYNNIGIIYEKIEEYDNAIKYFSNSISISKKINHLNLLAQTYNNIGLVYLMLNNYTKALYFINLALELDVKNGNENGINNCYSNIGSIYKSLCDYDKSLEYYSKSLTNSLKTNDIRNSISCYLNIGKIYSLRKNKDYNKSIFYIKKALKLLEQFPIEEAIIKCNYSLYYTYKLQKKYKEALLFHEYLSDYKSEVTNNQYKKNILKKELEYEYIKKKNKEDKIAQDKKDLEDLN